MIGQHNRVGNKPHKKGERMTKNVNEEEEESGVTVSVNNMGQMEIEIDLFEEDYEKHYNGIYVLERPMFEHQDLITAIMNDMNTTDNSWHDVAKEIAKSRGLKGSGSHQMKEVANLLKDKKLTPKEEEMFNAVTNTNSMDMKKVYKHAPALLKAIIIKSPVPMATEADINKLPLGLGRILFERGLNWMVDKFSISETRRKK